MIYLLWDLGFDSQVSLYIIKSQTYTRVYLFTFHYSSNSLELHQNTFYPDSIRFIPLEIILLEFFNS